ncbi:MAG TPA: anti-sigma factor [Terriglobales bacterium]
MTCIEFQDVLADMVDGETDAQHEAHLKSCSSCSELLADLRAIASGAKLLCADSEPSPRVWANIQRTLEAEGIIRPAAQPGAALFPRTRHWSPAWLISGAAVVLLAIGAFLYTSHYGLNQQLAETQVTAPAGTDASGATPDDVELLSHVSPAARATYADNLQTVNAFIRDAEDNVAQNPHDDEARHYLMQAYQERAMVYASAMDRSMP